MPEPKTRKRKTKEMRAEYHFDYGKARPNRFAGLNERVVVALDPDISKVFKTSEAVNNVLRALIETMPQKIK